MSSSTIMYKFRSSTTFEPLSMPGTSARLFDVKRAIVTAKKLDRSAGGHGLEFDLSVRNAMTNEEYDDESMLLPRGTRVIVQRLPAARGHGLLSKIARANAGMSSGGIGIRTKQKHGNSLATKSVFYNIDSTKRDDEDEFVTNEQHLQPNISTTVSHFAEKRWKEKEDIEEDRELAELRIVTDAAGSAYPSNNAFSRSGVANKFLAGPSLGGAMATPVVGASGGAVSLMHHYFTKPTVHLLHHLPPIDKPNADPELREHDARIALASQPKKRATGIPRTFLNLSVPNQSIDDGGNGNDVDDSNASVTDTGGLARLQPNVIGFQALITRGGGQSESQSDKNSRSLDYALKLTATTVPDYLHCGICHNVVKNAMLLPWDSEGRTTCESCIRDGLAQNGFRCPLTGQEGVSPDDLLPNHGLRKAAELFVSGVMEKMDEIVELKEQEEAKSESSVAGVVGTNVSGRSTAKKKIFYEGNDSLEKRVIMSGRMPVRRKVRSVIEDEDDLFGEDEFGRDVFDVSNEQEDERQNHDDDGEFGATYAARGKNEIDGTADDAEGDNSNIKITKENTISFDANFELSTSVFLNSTAKAGSGIRSEKNESIKSSNDSKSFDVSVQLVSKELMNEQKEENELPADDHTISHTCDEISKADSTEEKHTQSPVSKNVSIRRENMLKTRGPPPGYVMGPAGGVHGPSPLHSSSNTPFNYPVNEAMGNASFQASPHRSTGSDRGGWGGQGGRGGDGRGRVRTFRGGRGSTSGHSRGGNIVNSNNRDSNKGFFDGRQCRFRGEQIGCRKVGGYAEGRYYQNQQYGPHGSARVGWGGGIYKYLSHAGRGSGAHLWVNEKAETVRGNQYPKYKKEYYHSGNDFNQSHDNQNCLVERGSKRQRNANIDCGSLDMRYSKNYREDNCCLDNQRHILRMDDNKRNHCENMNMDSGRGRNFGQRSCLFGHRGHRDFSHAGRGRFYQSRGGGGVGSCRGRRGLGCRRG